MLRVERKKARSVLFLSNFSENLEGDREVKRASSELMMPALACGLFEALPVIVFPGAAGNLAPPASPHPPPPGGLGKKQPSAGWLLLHPGEGAPRGPSRECMRSSRTQPRV